MARLTVGSCVVALVSWVWSVLFYVISPVPYYTVSATGDDIAAGAALLEHFPESGTYIIPGPSSPDDVRAAMRGNGPVATVYIKREGAPAASPAKIAVGTLHGVVIGMLIGLGMRWLGRRGWGFTDKLALAAIFGTAYTAYPRVADIIWSDFPQGYQWMMIVSDGLSWILMAAVMAWFTEPRLGPARQAR